MVFKVSLIACTILVASIFIESSSASPLLSGNQIPTSLTLDSLPIAGSLMHSRPQKSGKKNKMAQQPQQQQYEQVQSEEMYKRAEFGSDEEAKGSGEALVRRGTDGTHFDHKNGVADIDLGAHSNKMSQQQQKPAAKAAVASVTDGKSAKTQSLVSAHKMSAPAFFSNKKATVISEGERQQHTMNRNNNMRDMPVRSSGRYQRHPSGRLASSHSVGGNRPSRKAQHHGNSLTGKEAHHKSNSKHNKKKLHARGHKGDGFHGKKQVNTSGNTGRVTNDLSQKSGNTSGGGGGGLLDELSGPNGLLGGF